MNRVIVKGLATSKPKQKTKTLGPVLTCGNYIERVDGAVYVRLDQTTVYFSQNKIIAIIHDKTMYRDADETQGQAYRRINAAIKRQQCREIKNISKPELHGMVEAAIMMLASRLVDEKLGINTNGQ